MPGGDVAAYGKVAGVLSADKLTQAKIDQMFSKTRKLVVAYLDPAPVDQLDRQLRDAQTSKGPF